MSAAAGVSGMVFQDPEGGKLIPETRDTISALGRDFSEERGAALLDQAQKERKWSPKDPWIRRFSER